MKHTRTAFTRYFSSFIIWMIRDIFAFITLNPVYAGIQNGVFYSPFSDEEEEEEKGDGGQICGACHQYECEC
jgi:hypothetical protein